jgi:hypothetical protein
LTSADPVSGKLHPAGKATAGLREQAALPLPLPGEDVPAAALPLARAVRLKAAQWARVSWRWRPVAAEPRPFDLDACLKRARTLLASGYRARERIGEAFAPQLSREEAWLWLQLLDYIWHRGWSEEHERALEHLRAVHAAGCPGDAAVREWAHAARRRPEWIYYNAPQLLRPFAAPEEIVALILGKCIADASDPPGPANRWHQPGPWRMTGFARLVAPYLDEGERTGLRGTLSDLHEAEVDRNAERAWLLIALLSTVGGGERLAAHVAAQPDRAWARDWRHGYDGYLEMLAGLPDEESFVREARRLGCTRGAPDLGLWLAATEWRELDVARDSILGMTTKDGAATRARILALVEAPEAAPVMLQLLTDSKAPAVGAQWFSAHPLHAAVGLTPVAMGQGRIAQAARQQLAALMHRGQAQVLAAATQHLTASQSLWLRRELLEAPRASLPMLSPADLPQELSLALAAVKAGRIPSWLALPSLPPLQVHSGRLPDALTAIILTALAEKPVGAAGGPGAALLAALRRHADQGSLDAFAWKLLELWLGMGAPSQAKWAMWAVGCLGGDGCVLKLTPLLRAWPGESQHARAVFGLSCLRAIGSDTALMALAGIAQKFKYKGLRQKAQEMIEDIARSRGLTTEQLADRIVPDCGLDVRGSRLFDLGPRTFRFVLGPGLKPLARDECGRLRPNLPAPARSDDAVKAAAALAGWRLLKKQLREVLKVQAGRLEDAMISGRRWDADEFQTLLVRHPLMINLVRLLVLGVHDGSGRLTGTCRVTEDQTLADQHDEEITLPPHAQVGVAHPAQLDEVTRAAWGQVLADYHLVPPFPQLSRSLCPPQAGELDGTAITRFAEPKVPGIVLYGMLERSHWLRDTPADAGAFVQHSRYFPSARLTAFIRYSPGLSIGWYEQSQQLTEIYFVPGHVSPASWGQHDNRIRIRDVDPVVLCEVLRLAQAIVAKA